MKREFFKEILERELRTQTPPRYSEAAVAVVLSEKGADLNLLLTRRAENPSDPWSGHVSFPGGRREPRDRSILETAIRETREEIALDLEHCGEVLGFLPSLQGVSRGKYLPLIIYPAVFFIQNNCKIEPNPKEVSEIFWVPFQFFLKNENRKSFPYRLNSAIINLPCYYYQSKKIWGLTLKMIDELVKRYAKKASGEKK